MYNKLVLKQWTKKVKSSPYIKELSSGAKAILHLLYQNPRFFGFLTLGLIPPSEDTKPNMKPHIS